MKAIIFDCDGTLVDSEEAHYLAWREVFQKFGYPLEKQFYIDHLCGFGDLKVAEAASELYGLKDLEELVELKDRCYEKIQEAGIRPILGTVAFFSRLYEEREKRGVKLAVASGARKADILSNLKSIGIDSHFDAILSGKDDVLEYFDPEGTNKPKPYVYLKAAKVLGVKPQECVAIEDSQVGIASAVSAGCFTVAVPNPFTQFHDLSLAHVQIESFEGLSVDEFFAKLVR